MLPKIRSFRGFTLIELLVVIAILSVLLVIVLVAINPARQTREARNTQRRADVLTILNAVNQYFVANGSFPSGATTSANRIDNSLTGFCGALVPDYVAALPFDPKPGAGYKFKDCNDYDTGYYIQVSTGDRVTVWAPETETGGSACTPGPTGDCIKATR